LSPSPTVDASPAVAASAKWTAIVLLAICEVLVMALWFSATAVVPALEREFGLGGQQLSLISSSVAVGFVAGTLVSAVLGLADRFDPRRLFAVCALMAAAANGAVLAVEPASLLVPALRFTVGACMAGIYPVGVKMVSTWAKGDMGLLTGLLVGAITLGTASPHLIDVLGGLDWRFTLAAASTSAIAGGLGVLFVRLGPNFSRMAAFKARLLLGALRNKPLRLANLGYFGHMWELYAMWAWMVVFLDASFALNPGGAEAPLYAKLLTFATIAVGALGCLFGGAFADRLGRTTLTMGAMAISGTCALLAGFAFGADSWLLTALCLVWGVAIVADSAQFTASVMELSEPGLIGTMVTAQTCAGFLLSTLTIHLIPPLVDLFGWQYAFAFLAVGPYLGVWAMASLRRHPDAVKLANGNR
jgi:MFS family permease